MPISVRLPQRVKQRLANYGVSHKTTKSAYELGKRFMGSDKRPGDVASDTKRLLRKRFRGK